LELDKVLVDPQPFSPATELSYSLVDSLEAVPQRLVQAVPQQQLAQMVLLQLAQMVLLQLAQMVLLQLAQAVGSSSSSVA
jgi:hypothetical protein